MRPLRRMAFVATNPVRVKSLRSTIRRRDFGEYWPRIALPFHS
jgi:hypothetical protein